VVVGDSVCASPCSRARVNRVKHTRNLVVEHKPITYEANAIGHFPHIKTRSHLNSEVNVWRGPLVLALETDREHETANRFLVAFWSVFGEVLFWNKIWGRCNEGTFLEQNLEKGRGVKMLYYISSISIGGQRVIWVN
jgi:hypothetical protein